MPTRYSPVRRFQYARSSENSLTYLSLDLHVLGTPPAFILSQDQTLNKKFIRGSVRCASIFSYPYCCLHVYMFFNSLVFCTMEFSRFIRSPFLGSLTNLSNIPPYVNTNLKINLYFFILATFITLAHVG